MLQASQANEYDHLTTILPYKYLIAIVLRHFACVFLEYAEALTNPIKHISQLHKRETQLAVLLEDNSEVRHLCGGVFLCVDTNVHFESVSIHVLQHIPNQPKDGEPGGESEVLQGGPSPFHVLPLSSLDDAPDIIKLPTPGRIFMYKIPRMKSGYYANAIYISLI